MTRRPNTRPTLIYWLIDTRPETIAAGWPVGKPFYCGKTVAEPKTRLACHRFDAKRCKTRPVSIRLLECGVNIRMDIIATVPPGGDWVTAERRWIAFSRAQFPDILNVAEGGTGVPGLIFTPEHLAKTSAAMKAKWQDPVYRAAQSEINRQRWKCPEYRAKIIPTMRPPTRECIEKASAARRGKPISDEQKAKMLAANLGKHLSPEHREKVGAFHRGKPKTAEQKLKMSVTQKARWAVRKRQLESV